MENYYQVTLTVQTAQGHEFDYTVRTIKTDCPVEAVVTANRTFREYNKNGKYTVLRAKTRRESGEYITDIKKSYEKQWTGD